MIKIDNKLISELGSKEKYIRAEHYNSLKVWWARRPIRAVRSILIREISSHFPDKEYVFPERLIHEINPDPADFNRFSQTYETNKITVLDVFSGGGSIPFESARLGCKTISAELNPVASILQETVYKYNQFDNFPGILRLEGNEVINTIEKRLGFLFNLNKLNPYVIFWGKTIICEGCSSEVSLSRIRYLVKKKNSRIIIEKGQIHFEANDEELNQKVSSNFYCNNCKKEYSFNDIKKYCKSKSLGSTPLAFCFHDKSKKKYLAIHQEMKEYLSAQEVLIDSELDKLKYLIPNEFVEEKNGVINPTLYDLKSPKDFFNKRQLLVLLTLINEIIISYEKYKKVYGVDFAKQIVYGLTTLIEFLVDWNSNGTMWISQNEQTGRALAGPGVGMKWDYIEINPFYKSGSNLRSKLDRVCKTFSAIHLRNEVEIINGSSISLPINSNEIDLIFTDPPYFDSVDYTALSEFFRPWFEVLFRNTFDKNINLKNDVTNEVIVQLSNSKRKDRNANHYQTLMTKILVESKRVLKNDGKIVLMYSHKTIDGWEVLAKSLRDAGLFIKDSYPLDMERLARPRAMSHQAISGVIIFEIVKNNEMLDHVRYDLERLLKSSVTFNNSHIPIYLASLACKFYTNTDYEFDICYKFIKDTYELGKSDFIKNKDLDILVKTYLEYLLIAESEDINDEKLELLQRNSLLVNEKLLSLEEIDINKLESEIFKELIKLYNLNKDNNFTKIKIDKKLRDNAIVFFRVLSGSDLNTVRLRSFTTEVKTCRIILSKINEV